MDAGRFGPVTQAARRLARTHVSRLAHPRNPARRWRVGGPLSRSHPGVPDPQEGRMTTVPDVLDRHPDKSVNPTPHSPVRLIARKEAAEIVTRPRGPAWLLVLTGALSGFSLLFVANTELSLLDNAQVVYDMLGAVTALGALLAVIAGADAIAG